LKVLIYEKTPEEYDYDEDQEDEDWTIAQTTIEPPDHSEDTHKGQGVLSFPPLPNEQEGRQLSYTLVIPCSNRGDGSSKTALRGSKRGDRYSPTPYP
jgi:hypothetical protein